MRIGGEAWGGAFGLEVVYVNPCLVTSARGADRVSRRTRLRTGHEQMGNRNGARTLTAKSAADTGGRPVIRSMRSQNDASCSSSSGVNPMC